jgi:hypothetical protein
MDAGSRSGEVIPAALWRRAAIVWMAFMLVETGHGAVRELFIAPLIGGLRARQLGVFIGSLLIFIVAWLLARWLNARTLREQLVVGGFWVALTLVFEMTLGRAMGNSWSRILSDYDPARGGLMLLGLAFMFCTPMLVKARTR